jgi:hypothetical protein
MTRSLEARALLLVLLAISGSGRGQAEAPHFTVTVGERRTVHAWEGDAHLATVLAQARGVAPVLVEFSPGVYEFERGVHGEGIRDLQLRGTAGTVFKLRSMPEWGRIRIAHKTQVAERALVVDRPDLVRPGFRYQLFLRDQRGGRLLECLVRSVEGERVLLAWQSVTHPGLEEIPSGAYMLPELNFFDGFRADALSFEDLAFDGNCDLDAMTLEGRPFYGHTTHCGILLRNLYRPPEPRPASRGLAIRRCRFRDLLGRAVAVYNWSAVLIEDCVFERIRTEAVEIDHWCSDAAVKRCLFDRCGLAIQLNDCNDTVVESCLILRCHKGLRILDALRDRSTNRGLAVRRCVFLRSMGAVLTDPHSDDNAFLGNVIVDGGPAAMRIGGDRNRVAGNLILGSSAAGIVLSGRDARLSGNLILPPTDGGDGFQPVRRAP